MYPKFPVEFRLKSESNSNVVHRNRRGHLFRTIRFAEITSSTYTRQFIPREKAQSTRHRYGAQSRRDPRHLKHWYLHTILPKCCQKTKWLRILKYETPRRNCQKAEHWTREIRWYHHILKQNTHKHDLEKKRQKSQCRSDTLGHARKRWDASMYGSVFYWMLAQPRLPPT